MEWDVSETKSKLRNIIGMCPDILRLTNIFSLGEQNGGKKLVGNSWIWKDKYD